MTFFYMIFGRIVACDIDDRDCRDIVAVYPTTAFSPPQHHKVP